MITSVYRRRPTTGEVNLTPLVDVTFQLIIFFILAGTLASQDRVDLDVPTLAGTADLADLNLPHKTVIHVAPHPADRRAVDQALRGPAAYWQVGSVRLAAGDTAGLTEELIRARAAFRRRRGAGEGEFQVEVRGDRSVWYSQVEPVLVSVAEAGFARVHYVAIGSEAN
jgi:biopolymer transport protein ExbD